MINHPCSIGRTELATRYFPNIQPQNAWQKLRGLLAEDPDLRPLTELRRRTFLPIEVNKIYQSLGQPWAAYFSTFHLSEFHARKPRLSIAQTPTFMAGNHQSPLRWICHIPARSMCKWISSTSPISTLLQITDYSFIFTPLHYLLCCLSNL